MKFFKLVCTIKCLNLQNYFQMSFECFWHFGISEQMQKSIDEINSYSVNKSYSVNQFMSYSSVLPSPVVVVASSFVRVYVHPLIMQNFVSCREIDMYLKCGGINNTSLNAVPSLLHKQCIVCVGISINPYTFVIQYLGQNFPFCDIKVLFKHVYLFHSCSHYLI